MTIAEQVYTIVQSLSEEQASQVLSFAATLQQRNAPSIILEDEETQMRWQELVRSTAGAFPDFPSLEEIRSGYGEDVPRECL